MWAWNFENWLSRHEPYIRIQDVFMEIIVLMRCAIIPSRAIRHHIVIYHSYSYGHSSVVILGLSRAIERQYVSIVSKLCRLYTLCIIEKMQHYGGDDTRQPVAMASAILAVCPGL